MNIQNYIRDIEPWFCLGLTISSSNIHEQGVFTTQYLPLGTLIMRLGGYLYHVSQRQSQDITPSTTTPLSEEVILAEPYCGHKDISDYLNHSCNPNIGFQDAISLIAIRDIQAGEELLIDYAYWECDATWKLKTICNCGNPNCRKAVTGEDWKLTSPSDSLFRYFSPFMKRRILDKSRGELSDDKS